MDTLVLINGKGSNLWIPWTTSKLIDPKVVLSSLRSHLGVEKYMRSLMELCLRLGGELLSLIQFPILFGDMCSSMLNVQ